MRSVVRAFLVVALFGGTAAAAARLYTKPGGFICPPTNLMGAGASASLVTCGGQGGTAVAIENESTTAVHLCAPNLADAGITPAQVTSSCPKRCSNCAAGSVYAPDIEVGQLYCASAGADAGVTVTVTCAK